MCTVAINVRLESASYTVAEGGTVEVCTVVNNGRFERSIQLYISSESDSAQEEDYAVIHMEHLTLQPQDTRSCISVETRDDDLVEGAEAFQVTITAIDSAAVITIPRTTTIQIIDNDCRLISSRDRVFYIANHCSCCLCYVDARFGFESLEYSFSEGPGTQSVAVVLLEHELTSPVSVQFTATDMSASELALICVAVIMLLHGLITS